VVAFVRGPHTIPLTPLGGPLAAARFSDLGQPQKATALVEEARSRSIDVNPLLPSSPPPSPSPPLLLPFSPPPLVIPRPSSASSFPRYAYACRCCLECSHLSLTIIRLLELFAQTWSYIPAIVQLSIRTSMMHNDAIRAVEGGHGSKTI
jgi:hypothetical protein